MDIDKFIKKKRFLNGVIYNVFENIILKNE